MWRCSKPIRFCRAVENAWSRLVTEPHFGAGQWQRQSEAVRSLYHDIDLLGLHSVAAASRKVAKSRASGAVLDAMRAFCAEALALHEAVASLKSKTVKGRASSAKASTQNPNKLVQTWPVCFRAIAVVAGTMAHHGYRRPGPGFQSASCACVRFKPLEVSREGLLWLIESLRERLDIRRVALLRCDRQPEFLLARPVPRGPLEKLGRDDPLWPQAFDRHLIELAQTHLPRTWRSTVNTPGA